MSTCKKRVLIGIVVGIVCIMIVLGVYNACSNENFFDASFTTCISIAVAVGVSYFLSQWQTDKRKQKDVIFMLLTSLQTLVNERDTYKVEASTSAESIMMRKRDISNRIEILKKFEVEFGLSAEIGFISDKFSAYENLISDHIQDLEYLQQSTLDMRRVLDLIDGKLFEAMLKLYT